MKKVEAIDRKHAKARRREDILLKGKDLDLWSHAMPFGMALMEAIGSYPDDRSVLALMAYIKKHKPKDTGGHVVTEAARWLAKLGTRSAWASAISVLKLTEKAIAIQRRKKKGRGAPHTLGSVMAGIRGPLGQAQLGLLDQNLRRIAKGAGLEGAPVASSKVYKPWKAWLVKITPTLPASLASR